MRTEPHRENVYIAGVGAITPLGKTWKESVPKLLAGESAVRRVDTFDVSGFPSVTAAAIPNAWLPNAGDCSDRRLALLKRATEEALAQVGTLDAQASRIGVFVGAESGRATVQTILALTKAAGVNAQQTAFDHGLFGKNAAALAPTIDAATVSPAAVTSWLARRVGAKGPCHTLSIACASGAIAIADGARSIALGLCDVAVCAGVGADVDPLMLVGFGKLGALSVKGKSCPFDSARDGFVVGEGAAVVILTRKRPEGDKALRVSGTGRSLDAHHITAPDPKGGGAERAMRRALGEAGRDRVDYIQAHGTSTQLNDVVESEAISRVFSEQVAAPWVSSVKGGLGHWIAGAGALGTLCAVSALGGQVIPTAGLVSPDSRCSLRHVLVGVDVKAKIRSCLVNSFAFGGANCSLLIEECS